MRSKPGSHLAVVVMLPRCTYEQVEGERVALGGGHVYWEPNRPIVREEPRKPTPTRYTERWIYEIQHPGGHARSGEAAGGRVRLRVGRLRRGEGAHADGRHLIEAVDGRKGGNEDSGRREH